MRWLRLLAATVAAALPCLAAPHPSPVGLALSPDGSRLYVAEGPTATLRVWELARGDSVATANLPGPPTGLALSPDGSRLAVTGGEGTGWVRLLMAGDLSAAADLPAGHSPCAPCFSPDGRRLYVAERFTNQVAAYSLDRPAERQLGQAVREPVALAVTPDGSRLVVANLLPAGAADVDHVAAVVTVLDAASLALIRQVSLPNGSGSLRGVAVSPDGRYAYVTSILSRYQLPTTQLARGWMNTNALQVIDLAEPAVEARAVLLDDPDAGAANPHGVAVSPDGQWLLVTHAGTHEVSLIQREALHQRLAERPDENGTDLTMMVDLRQRLKLPARGPREIVVSGTTAWVGCYFGDQVLGLELGGNRPRVATVLGPEEPATPTPERLGESLFADAALCFQGWQSCLSCHPDARVDAFNWDLLNDGLGNPKNTRSMLLSHATPPAMSRGVRETAETAVRSGIRFIQFAIRPESDAVAIDRYLQSLRPTPSPWLVDGQLSPAAQRGQRLFDAEQVGCRQCHGGPHLTDQKQYDLGTGRAMEVGVEFDTPTLVEVWRTAPYLHDGRAPTLQSLFTEHNPGDRHGRTSQLSKTELADLIAYLASL